MEAKGKIHSIESLGTLDGPGIRTVIFFQGCPLRCQYCHNPDTWNPIGGETWSVSALMAHIRRYRTYHTTSKGGVTLSGGEPGLQPDFSLRLLETCRQEGIHSALDTSGFMSLHTASSLISAAELILLDIKHMDADAHIRLTGQNNTPVLEFARLSSKKKTPLWVRQVLLPGWTDNPKQLTQLAQFLSTLDNLERLELLPYHRMGVHKWKALRFDYELEGVMPPDARLVNQAKDAIMSYNANLPLV